MAKNPFSKPGKPEAADIKKMGRKAAVADEKSESPATRKKEAGGFPFGKKKGK